VRPSVNIGFISIWNTNRQPVEFGFPLGRKMENIFMAIIQKPTGIDGLEMAVRVGV
jgi:hypothetical protein